MKFALKELDTITTEQEVTIGNTALDMDGIRPHIYRFGNPTGSIQVEILDSLKRLIQKTEILTIASIDTTPPSNEDFFHGYVLFKVNWPAQANTKYHLRLVGLSGYTFSETAGPATGYIGWVKAEPDFRKGTATFSPNTGFNSELDWEPWIKKKFIRGSQ